MSQTSSLPVEVCDSHLHDINTSCSILAAEEHDIERTFIVTGETLAVQSIKAVQSVDCGIGVTLLEYRKALIAGNLDANSSVMLLSIALSLTNLSSDSISVASALLERFGSVANLMIQSSDHLKSAACLSDENILVIRTLSGLFTLAFREPVIDRPLLSSSQALHAYLRFTMANSNVELVRLLFLNSKNMLLKDEIHSVGTLNDVKIYPREILRRSIELNASALIIVHNHPSGDATPSQQDIEMTGILQKLLTQVHVCLHDHVIVGKESCVSMSSLGCMV